MIKKNKWMLLITSIVILLPILAGLCLWSRLPNTIATHFGANNEPNGWSSKEFAVFGLPCIVLAIHWFAVLMTAADRKSKNINPVMMKLLLWICPSISLIVSTLTYTFALGAKPNIGLILILFFGVLFLILGNYLPKCRQNHSLGIRTRWTLASSENWQKTHRFAGWSMSIGGVLILASAFLQNPWIFFILLLLSIVTPAIYSYFYFRKQRKEK